MSWHNPSTQSKPYTWQNTAPKDPGSKEKHWTKNWAKEIPDKITIATPAIKTNKSLLKPVRKQKSFFNNEIFNILQQIQEDKEAENESDDTDEPLISFSRPNTPIDPEEELYERKDIVKDPRDTLVYKTGGAQQGQGLGMVVNSRDDAVTKRNRGLRVARMNRCYQYTNDYHLARLACVALLRLHKRRVPTT